jgi:hypothetical protein
MCAFLTKPIMVDFFIIIIVSTIVSYLVKEKWQSMRKIIISIALYILGIITIIIPWYIILYAPHQRIYQIFVGKDIDYRIPFSLNRFIINIWKTPIAHYFTSYLPIMFVCALLFVLIAVLKIISLESSNRIIVPKQKLLPIEILAVTWFIGDYLFNSIVNYKPLRFFVDMIPATTILFVAFIKYIWEFHIFSITKLRLIQLIALFIWGFFTLQYYVNEHIYALYEMTHLSIFAYFRKQIPYTYYYGYSLIIAMSLTLTLILYFISLKYRDKKVKVPMILTKGGCALLLVLSIGFQINLYYQWATKHRSYKIIDYSRFLLHYIPNGPISGNIAPMLCFENEFKAYLIYRDRNNWYNHPFELYKITHMQMANPHDERDGYFYGFPEIMQKARVVATFPLRGRTEELWARNPSREEFLTMHYLSENQVKLKNSDKKLSHYAWIINKNNSIIEEMVHLAPDEEKILNYKHDDITFRYADFDFEFETAKKEVGMPIFDLQASNNIAVKSDKRPKSIIFSKWFPLLKNEYMIVIRIKNANRQIENIFSKMRIYNKNDELIKEMSLPIPPAEEKYYEVSAGFVNPVDQPVIIEIYNPEVENVFFDILQIIPIKEKKI